MIKFNLYELGDKQILNKDGVNISQNSVLDNLPIKSYTIQNNTKVDIDAKEMCIYVVNGVLEIRTEDKVQQTMSGDCIMLKGEKVSVSPTSGYQAMFVTFGK